MIAWLAIFRGHFEVLYKMCVNPGDLQPKHSAQESLNGKNVISSEEYMYKEINHEMVSSYLYIFSWEK